MTEKLIVSQNSKFKIHNTKLGFTLIELLVVISIIGLLAALGTARYLVAEKAARDTQRKSDLNQYRTVVENYASANESVYPVAADLAALCTAASTYLSGACMHDPRAVDGYTDYFFSSDGTDFVVWAKLESGGYFEICSNGKVGKIISDSDPGSACAL